MVRRNRTYDFSNRFEPGLNVIVEPSPGRSRTTAAITHPDRRPFGPTPKEFAPEADPSMAESPWVRVHETLGAEATAGPPAGGGARPMFRPRASGQGSRPATPSPAQKAPISDDPHQQQQHT
jgi:hypothetical protein